MTEFYPEIRLAHVLAVIASGCLFCLRGLLVTARRPAWALATPVRYLSYAIDTMLLIAALMLFAILPPAVFSNGWLAAKLALLPAYVALGWLALRRPARRGRQFGYFAGALFTYGTMIAIAHTHDPLGPMRLLAGT
jgi:uncharacterized membrane protein SirB2